MKILCVDDDPYVLSFYQDGLAELMPSAQISTASGGQQAIDMLQQHSYDVVISDLMMPDLTGIDVLKYVKSQDLETTEVIIVTGAGSVETAVEAMQLGARDYIEKPIVLTLLIEKLENIEEFMTRLQEAEEYRLAKEVYEQESGDQQHALELRLQEMRSAMEQSHILLADYLSQQPQAATDIKKAADLLQPFVE